MPGQPYPVCCNCWDCPTKPDSVDITANVVSGDFCCNQPNGTFVLGAASSSTLDSSNMYLSNIGAQGIILQSAAVPCSWTWDFKQRNSSSCVPSTWSNYTDDLSGVIDYVSLCQQTSLPGTVDGIVVMDILRIHIRYLTSFPAPNTGRRIAVHIYRQYKGLLCGAGMGTSGQQAFNIQVKDEYLTGVLDCSSLPVSISHSARIKSHTGVNVTVVGDTYTHNSTLAYTLCPPISDVYINYV